MDDEGLKAACHDANKYSWSKEELEAYDYAAVREQDERGKITAAEKREKLGTAKEIKRLGVGFDIIKQVTGLSDEEIESLKRRGTLHGYS